MCNVATKYIANLVSNSQQLIKKHAINAEYLQLANDLVNNCTLQENSNHNNMFIGMKYQQDLEKLRNWLVLNLSEVILYLLQVRESSYERVVGVVALIIKFTFQCLSLNCVPYRY